MYRNPFQHGGQKSPLGQRSRPPQPSRPTQSQYEGFRASLLYCPTCKTATQPRERLLLVLPTGNFYEYLCTQCGTSTGEKTEQEKPDVQLFMP